MLAGMRVGGILCGRGGAVKQTTPKDQGTGITHIHARTNVYIGGDSSSVLVAFP